MRRPGFREPRRESNGAGRRPRRQSRAAVQEATFSPELAAITLTSGLKNVGQSIIWIFDEWDAGRTYWGKLVNLGLTEGGVGIVTDKNFANVAPKTVQDQVLAAEAAIKDGTIVVPSAIGDDTNAVVALRDSMQP